MKVFTYLDDIYDIGPTCVALGNFDGVHKGHQTLISSCVEYAKVNGLTPVVFTFLNHPSNFIAGRTVVKGIQGLFEKTEQIEALGAEYMVTAMFNESVMNLEPEVFTDAILVKRLNMKQAFCGFNYSYGYMAKGTPETLRIQGEKFGFGVSVLDPVKIDGQTVSSTLIRNHIAEGDMERFAASTGRAYSIMGRVMVGQHLGTRMGFPTVNLNLDPRMVLPCNGVYVTKTYVNNAWYPSITNVGIKPTVGLNAKNAETHIFGFSEDVYGKTVKVEFIKMLRPEMKFDSVEELSKQIAKDCHEAESIHEAL